MSEGTCEMTVSAYIISKKGASMTGERTRRKEQQRTAAARRKRVLELTIQGLSQREIAEVVGVRKSQVARDYAKAFAETVSPEEIEQLRGLENLRLDYLLRPLSEAFNRSVEAGSPDLAIIDRLVKISARRAALNGLDLPEKTAAQRSMPPPPEIIAIEYVPTSEPLSGPEPERQPELELQSDSADEAESEGKLPN